jgi:hypothetical protein
MLDDLVDIAIEVDNYTAMLFEALTTDEKKAVGEAVSAILQQQMTYDQHIREALAEAVESGSQGMSIQEFTERLNNL